MTSGMGGSVDPETLYTRQNCIGKAGMRSVFSDLG